MTQAQRKPRRRTQIEPMLCDRATRSSPFRENFINRPSIGKRFSRQTEKISATRKSLRSVRPGLATSMAVSPGGAKENAEQLTLPWNQQGRCARTVGRDGLERATWRNE